MKLAIGMYVRDKRDGKIYKINEFNLNFRSQKKTYDFEKASYDIIDLIEVGDYINGNRIDKIDKFKDGSVYLQFGDAGQYYCKNYNIKSIVTKEQLEAMEYKVGEE